MKPTYLLLAIFVFCIHCNKDTDGIREYLPGQPYFHNSSPGTSAKDFLRSTNFNSLQIEIQYMPGLRPEQLSLDLFTNMLRERLNKPAGVTIVLKEINPTLQTIFSKDDISDLESLNRTGYTYGDQLAAYILLINGSFEESNALALAYHNTSVCVFGEPVRYFSGGFTEDIKAKVMAILLMHEFGHLFGLVDMGSNMVVGHSDYANANHCTNNDCLMHYSYTDNSRFAIGELNEVPSLDVNCVNDLRANGGK